MSARKAKKKIWMIRSRSNMDGDPTTAGGSLAKASEVVSCAAPPPQAAAVSVDRADFGSATTPGPNRALLRSCAAHRTLRGVRYAGFREGPGVFERAASVARLGNIWYGFLLLATVFQTRAIPGT